MLTNYLPLTLLQKAVCLSICVRVRVINTSKAKILDLGIIGSQTDFSLKVMIFTAKLEYLTGSHIKTVQDRIILYGHRKRNSCLFHSQRTDDVSQTSLASSGRDINIYRAGAG